MLNIVMINFEEQNNNGNCKVMRCIHLFFCVTLTTAAPLQNNTILNSNSDFSSSSTFQYVYAALMMMVAEMMVAEMMVAEMMVAEMMKEVKKVVMKEVKKVVMKEVKKVVMKEVVMVMMKAKLVIPLAAVQQEINLHSLVEVVMKVHRNQTQQMQVNQQKVQLGPTQ